MLTNRDPHYLDLGALPVPDPDFTATPRGGGAGSGAQLVLVIAGELDAASAPLLHAAAERLWPRLVLGHAPSGPSPELSVDCTGLRFVDLSGLRAMEALAQRARAAGTTMRAGGLNEFTRRLLELCGLSPTWAVTERQARLTQG